ncbi:CPBP family intramembrane glutamic endopeptidase [Methanobrevibacter sp.]|uniref:CPBP family intramembrane glutamic endopeptidase n=1 Tax=Methanobrevibacter sp. TaxID=66852 RepID=UPI0025DD1DAB|nr:type II CAAX endopeptidase family protein [Methanobrevibacter sp.]MBR4447035.1 CPBP family intramembrane metalloprotease [Methanobrevibacter sp.]
MNIHKKFFSKIGTNYLILGAIALICQIILINILNATHPEYVADINILSGLASFCNYVIPFPVFYWLMKKLKKVEIEKNGVDLKTFFIYISITLTLMWIGNIIGLAVTMLLSGAIQTDISNPVQQLINSADIWFNLLVISIIAPICEEIIFRKMLIDRTIRYGAKVSIVLSALIFAFFHGNLNQFFYAFLMGGFFAYVYIKTGKITYTIILHAIVNFMGSVMSIMVANAATSLQSGFNPTDATILVVYITLLFIFIAVGFYGLITFKKAKLDGKKTEITLENPIRTALLNYGMVLFMLFFIGEMIYQIMG